MAPIIHFKKNSISQNSYIVLCIFSFLKKKWLDLDRKFLLIEVHESKISQQPDFAIPLDFISSMKSDNAVRNH